MTLHEVLAPFATHLFTLGTDQVTVAELAGFVTGAIGVWLTVKRKLSNFPVGLANNAFFLLLFLDARLYADAWLQVVYLVLGVQGWWAWLRFGPGRTQLTVKRTSAPHLIAVAIGIVGCTAILLPILRGAHDVAPFYDALTTGLSLGAQWLLNLKRLENWAFWAVADVIYIPLYVSKDLVLTSIVYVIFLVLCGLGARDWLKTYRTGMSEVPAVQAESLPQVNQPVAA